MSRVERSPKSGKIVLIVDDEPDMRTISIHPGGKMSGYRPVVARNGKEGIQMALDAGPDLLILDVMMPGEGGVLMYHKIKTDVKLKGIPVITLSAIARKTFYHYLRMLAIRLGEPIPSPEAYVEKPPETEELIGIIEGLLG